VRERCSPDEGAESAELAECDCEAGDVADDGDGFDPGALPDPTRHEHLLRDTGRGLFVIRHLVDGVDFNAKGNAICLTLRVG